MNYLLSPELQRQLWLRFTPVKLAAAPVVIALLAYIALAGATDAAGRLVNMATVGFFLAAGLGGTYQAAAAFQEEIKNKTWDGQKMSCLTPAQLAFGKLFGATSYLWYVGGIMLLIIFFAAPQMAVHQGAGKPDIFMPFGDVLYSLFSMVAAALIGQGIALLASLSDATLTRNKLGRLYIPTTMMPFILGFLAVQSTLSYNDISTLDPTRWIAQQEHNTSWFGWTISTHSFYIASTLFFIGLIFMGIYRIMQKELMYPQTPACWAGAAWALGLYFAGRLPVDLASRFSTTPLFLFSFFLIVSYAMALLEAGDTEIYTRFMARYREKNWRALLQNTPRWVSTAVFLPALYVVAIFNAAVARLDVSSIVSLMTSAFFFCLRDGLVIHAVNTGTAPRNTRFYNGLYFFTVYLLLPSVQAVMTGRSISAARQGVFSLLGDPWSLSHEALNSAALFYPTVQDSVLMAVLPALLQAGLAAWWLKQRRLAARAGR